MLQSCRLDCHFYNMKAQYLRTHPTNPEQRKFIGYSIRSLAEVVTCLIKAKRRKYISEENFDSFYDEAFSLMNMMNAFRKNIN